VIPILVGSAEGRDLGANDSIFIATRAREARRVAVDLRSVA
jgi:hypothetical protein